MTWFLIFAGFVVKCSICKKEEFIRDIVFQKILFYIRQKSIIKAVRAKSQRVSIGLAQIACGKSYLNINK